jgi:uncharacterized membrane protein
MKPLIVLIVVFLLALVINWLLYGNPAPEQSGRIAMSTMLLFTSIGHYKFRKGMASMLPPAVPGRQGIVLLTGLIEIAAAVGLLIPQTRAITAVCLIIFFVSVLPANIYATMKNLNYETGEYDGNGMKYLWFRVPLQALFIIWVYWFALE